MISHSPRRKCTDTNYFHHFPLPPFVPAVARFHPYAFMVRFNIRLDYSLPLSENFDEKDPIKCGSVWCGISNAQQFTLYRILLSSPKDECTALLLFGPSFTRDYLNVEEIYHTNATTTQTLEVVHEIEWQSNLA